MSFLGCNDLSLAEMQINMMILTQMHWESERCLELQLVSINVDLSHNLLPESELAKISTLTFKTTDITYIKIICDSQTLLH